MSKLSKTLLILLLFCSGCCAGRRVMRAQAFRIERGDTIKFGHDGIFFSDRAMARMLGKTLTEQELEKVK